jgi:hypothetical protein
MGGHHELSKGPWLEAAFDVAILPNDVDSISRIARPLVLMQFCFALFQISQRYL